MTRTVMRWLAGSLAALAGAANVQTPLDMQAFADLGRSVLAGRFDEAYADTFNQAGPLQLVISRLLAIGGQDGAPHLVTRIVVAVALVLGAMAVCRGRPLREAAVAGLTLLWLAGPLPWHGHPAETTIPVLWAYAMVLHRRDHRLAAAVTLGASALIAPVAVLGFPCLLAVTGPARAVRAMAVAAAITVAGYLPFALSGDFHLFGHVWPVFPDSVPALLGLHEVTWATRLAQAVVAAGGCALVAWRLRGRRVAIAAAPLAAALLRVVTDPVMYGYYWAPVAVGSVLLLALLPDESPGWRQVVVAALGYGALLAVAVDAGGLGALACLSGFLLAGLGAEPRDRSEAAAAEVVRAAAG